MIKKLNSTIAIIILLSFLSSCGTEKPNGPLTASGTISAREVNISSEVSGRVVGVMVQESQVVKSGDQLIMLDQSLLGAQVNSADAAISLAEANVKTAQAAFTTLNLQYLQVLNIAHLADAANRSTLWKKSQPDDVELPGWYFTKPERTAAAKLELDSAKKNLEDQQTNLAQVIKDLNIPSLADMEKHLIEAEAAFMTAKASLDLANNAADQQELRKAAQDACDAAKKTLNDTEAEYNSLLTNGQADQLMNARALVALAQQTYDEAIDRYNALLTANDSLQVAVSKASVDQAQAAIDQANAALAQAKAARKVLEVQLTKTGMYSPVDGVVITRNVEPGEMATPGGTLLVIGELEIVQLTVYVPEDRYGQVQLGQSVSISVDSYPGEIFNGKVLRIADQAEFTPRNVQTVDGRRTTVYAIEIEVPNPDYRLKPGMPADVQFAK